MLEAWTKGSKVPFRPSHPRYPLHGRRNTDEADFTDFRRFISGKN
jgi:hypothetical protein